MSEPTSRICREVQTHLPDFVDGTLPRWRRRLVGRHVARCEACAAALRRQQEVAVGLQALGEATADATPPVAPPELLDRLLETVERPGMRGRAAAPARAAVSGARPALSATLLVIAAAAGTAVGYAGLRGARAIRRRAGHQERA
ncbi:anti-sigma factor [Egicoccus sp. AB-alg2]|uniref:anti-sigma factor family protein n=1 Tax=Egicoccus sp. AB-alg2 TaxID=3242693 RepID=UPI00359D4035